MITQIYEIQSPEEAEKCIEIGVDHVGSVILHQDEWRYQQIRDLVRLSSGTEVKNSLITLFRDADTLYRCIDYYRPDYIHFCESLTDEQGRKANLKVLIDYQREMKKRFPEIGIMRSIPIPRNRIQDGFPTLEIARELVDVSDIFLTDTWLEEEPVEGYIGITGKTCDRDMAKELVSAIDIPVILAGGLSPENVFEAITEARSAGADSCTGTNMRDEKGNPLRFKKDFARVKEFVSEIRRASEEFALEEEQLAKELGQMKEELKERERALPPHSVRPHQLIAIEELEEEISLKEKEMLKLRWASGKFD